MLNFVIESYQDLWSLPAERTLERHVANHDFRLIDIQGRAIGYHFMIYPYDGEFKLYCRQTRAGRGFGSGGTFGDVYPTLELAKQAAEAILVKRIKEYAKNHRFAKVVT